VVLVVCRYRERALRAPAETPATENPELREQRVDELEAMDGALSAESIAPDWRMQLGSLGSGNHFIEVSLDEQDRLWLFLHSGSRGVGNKLANKHIKMALHLCRKWWISLPDPDLAYLVEGTDE
jgi:tRNA-splicing ligase RtcB (3'-phosphate/5'-hydroxy nucleic acid ligase)